MRQMNKYVLKDRVRNLSPISKDQGINFDSYVLDDFKKEINQIDFDMTADHKDYARTMFPDSKIFISKEVLLEDFKIKSDVNMTKNDDSILPNNFKINQLEDGNEIKVINSISGDVNTITSNTKKSNKSHVFDFESDQEEDKNEE